MPLCVCTYVQNFSKLPTSKWVFIKINHNLTILYPLTNYENFHFLAFLPVLDTTSICIFSQYETFTFFEVTCNISKMFYSKPSPAVSSILPLQVMVFRHVTIPACLLEILQFVTVTLQMYFQELIIMVQLNFDLACVQNRTITYLLLNW